MSVTSKQYVVYALHKNVRFDLGAGIMYLDVIQVVGFYGTLANAQDAAASADNNQTDDVWIVKLEQHRT